MIWLMLALTVQYAVVMGVIGWRTAHEEVEQ